MRIALISTEKLPVPPVAGGAVQLYINGILPFLSRKHDITVFSISYPGLPDRETVNGVKHIRLPGGSNTKYLNGLKAILDNSYDLIHVFNRPRYVVELMDILPNVRMSLSLHNEMFHPEKITDADGLKCIRKVEFINTVSKYIADTVKLRFSSAESKLRVVYSGVDTELFKPVWSKEGQFYKKELKYRLGIPGRKTVLFVGRLSNKKGVHILLKAMEAVMSAVPDAALAIIGSKWYGSNEPDEYTESLKTVAARIRGPIVFTGFLTPSEIYKYYCTGDVFVCASQWNEPLARVHYEAMAAGLPIITTNRGGNAEVVQGFGNGIIINDYSNHVQMADKIAYLLRNPAEALKMGGKGRLLAEHNFTWERVAGEIFPENIADIAFSVRAKSTGSPVPVQQIPETPALAASIKEPAVMPIGPVPAVKPEAKQAVQVQLAQVQQAVQVRLPQVQQAVQVRLPQAQQAVQVQQFQAQLEIPAAIKASPPPAAGVRTPPAAGIRTPPVTTPLKSTPASDKQKPHYGWNKTTVTGRN